MRRIWGRTICPCCERKVTGITAHKDPVCELERGNIKDVETLHKLIDKYFTSEAEFIDDKCKEHHVPCMCCFYRDIKHFIDVENTVNEILLNDTEPVRVVLKKRIEDAKKQVETSA